MSLTIVDILGQVSVAIVVFNTICASELGFAIYVFLNFPQNSLCKCPHLTMWTVNHHSEIYTMCSNEYEDDMP